MVSFNAELNPHIFSAKKLCAFKEGSGLEGLKICSKYNRPVFSFADMLTTMQYDMLIML